MPFKLSLVSDVRSWLKGTQDVEKSLEGVADSLDDLATQSATDSDRAADTLERNFTDAFDQVKTEARTTGRKIGDDVRDGTRRATQGVDDFKNEGRQSIRETAASFSDVTDALDLVQEVAANAFTGFGPAGMAAGALAAIGLGAVKTVLDATADKANKAREATADLAGELIDVKGNPAALDWADKLKAQLLEVVNTKEWYEFWEADNGPATRLQEWSTKAKEYGVDMHDVTKMLTGDREAEARVLDTLNAKQAELNRVQVEANQTGVGVAQTYFTQAAAVGAFTTELTNQSGQLRSATDLANLFAESTDGAAEAQKRAQEVAAEWATSLNEHLSVAGDGLDTFVKDGKLNLKEWADEVKARAKDVATVEDFRVDVFPKLSPETQAAFAKLPVDTQAQIAKAYKDGDKGDKKLILSNLKAEAKVSVSAADTKVDGVVTIPTEVDTDSATKGTREAADAAQREANKTSNVIEFKTRVDASSLQAQVNRAAATITPPTVWVNVKAKKEVP